MDEAAVSAIQRLNLDSVVMIGHSLGAKVGCLLLSGTVMFDKLEAPPEFVCACLGSIQLVHKHITQEHACRLWQAIAWFHNCMQPVCAVAWWFAGLYDSYQWPKRCACFC